MWAAFANLLVCKRPPEDLGEVGGRPIHLQALIQAVHQTVEELKCIVLLPKLHTLTPQPITSTYITCNMQLLMYMYLH